VRSSEVLIFPNAVFVILHPLLVSVFT